MNYCERCGAPAREGARLCPDCAAEMRRRRQQNENRQPVRQRAYDDRPRQRDFEYDAPRPRRYNDEPNGNYRPAPARRDVGFTQEDIQQNKAMAVLAYFGILVLIPLFAAKHSRYARYHTNQGLALCIAAIIYSVVYGILSSVLLAISWRLYFVLTILGVVSIFFFVLMIIGIVNAAGGKTKPLPLVGKMRILKY